MDVVVMDRKTYEELMSCLNMFALQIKELCGENKDIDQQWLDNQEVCQLLSISKRTLQYYRDSGIISYSQIGNKCYYPTSDIEKLIRQSQLK